MTTAAISLRPVDVCTILWGDKQNALACLKLSKKHTTGEQLLSTGAKIKWSPRGFVLTGKVSECNKALN